MLDGPALLGRGNGRFAGFRRTFLCLAAIALLESGAVAEPAYYFHKPSVDRSTFESELGGCLELGSGVSVRQAYAYSPTPYAAAIGGFFGGIMASRERRAIVLNIMRTCMADKGYRRVVAPKEVVSKLAALGNEDKTSGLFDLATAAAPLGKVLPR